MKKILYTFLALCLFATSTFAQLGINDPSFNVADYGVPGYGTGFNGSVHTTSIQADGKIIVGGDFTRFHETGINRIARLNIDGSLDATFNPGTGFSNTVQTTSIQSDGKIIVGWSFTSFNDTQRNYIARLNADGSLDETFNPGTGFNGTVRTTSIQSDGKIIAGGWFTRFNGMERNHIARLNADGSLDETFNPGTGFNVSALTTSIQSDGKIIVGGMFTTFNRTPRTRIARLNVDGSLDTTFNPGTGFINTNLSGNRDVYTTSIQSDGKIIVGGGFTSFNGKSRNGIARLNADGSLDETFNPGTGFNGWVNTTSIQVDGKIIVGGWFSFFDGTPRNYIARLLNCSTPTPDSTTDVSVCDSYILPELTVGDYYTASNGEGVKLNAGDVITSTQTLYVYTATEECSYENSFVVTINTSPSNTVSIEGNTITAIQTDATYQWLDCDNGNLTISEAINQNFTTTESGNFAVEVTKDGCSSTSDCVSIIVLGLNEEPSFNFSAFPNPTTGVLTISLGDVYSDVTVVVRNAMGQLVKTKNYNSTNILDLTMEGELGIYFVEIRTGENSAMLKVIKN